MKGEVCINKDGTGLGTSIDLEKSEESLKSAAIFSVENSVNKSHHHEQHRLQSLAPEPMTKSPCNKEPLLHTSVVPDDIQSLPVKGENLNQLVAMEAMKIDTLRTRSVFKRSAKTKKKANTLMLHCCHGQRHRPVKFCLRGRKLMAALTAKKIQVTAINVKLIRRLPTGSNNHVISNYLLSLEQRRPRANHHGQRTNNMSKCGALDLEGDVRELDGNKWLEVERTRLSQRSGSSSTTYVHELQKKFTDELDSAAPVAMEMEHDTSRLLSMGTNSENNRTVTVGRDEIDDIFGALDGMT